MLSAPVVLTSYPVTPCRLVCGVNSMMSVVTALVQATLFTVPVETAWQVPVVMLVVASAMVVEHTICGSVAGVFIGEGITVTPLPTDEVFTVVEPLDEPSSLKSPSVNDCAAVQVFAWPTFSDATTAPVVGVTVNVLSEFDTEATAPVGTAPPSIVLPVESKVAM